jgi:hypothetical protein
VQGLNERWQVGSVQADTVKFIFIYWRPENIPISRKMKIGVFEGKLQLS